MFLVEDESLIREGIKKLVAWNEYGFSFAGEAQDGELAWPLIQKQRPDIVITDIKMPFMDGLALSRLIKKELPATTIIILSGYDDFSYAREAISIGVSQYLLKPLSKGQLVEMLGEVKRKKDAEQEQSRYLAQFSGEVQEYLTGSRRAFLDCLVSGRYSVPELLERAERLNLNLTAERYNIVLFLLEEDLLETGYSAQLANVQEDLGAAFPEDGRIVMFSLGVDMIVFLVKADAEEIEQSTARCVQTLEAICRPLEKTVRWSVSVGKPVSRLSVVGGCYHAARRELFHPGAAQAAGEKKTAAVVDFDPNAMDATKMDQRIVEKFLASGLSEELPGFVEDYFAAVGGKAVQSMMFRQYIVLHIQFTVNAFLEKLGYSREEARESNTEPQLQEALASVEGAERYVRALLARALSLRENVINSRYTGMLQKAMDYMRAHFTEQEISLNAVACAANVSATHFSAVFSQQMGRTFVEYLTELRMEKARELLRCTDQSSGEIAFSVGYNDPHYFSFLFKKVNGCTPRDYRSGRNPG